MSGLAARSADPTQPGTYAGGASSGGSARSSRSHRSVGEPVLWAGRTWRLPIYFHALLPPTSSTQWAHIESRRTYRPQGRPVTPMSGCSCQVGVDAEGPTWAGYEGLPRVLVDKRGLMSQAQVDHARMIGSTAWRPAMVSADYSQIAVSVRLCTDPRSGGGAARLGWGGRQRGVAQVMSCDGRTPESDAVLPSWPPASLPPSGR